MKRVFKMIFSCALALVVLSVSAVTFYALQAKAASGVTIYFKNTMNWSDVYCYMYYGSGDNGPAWPGTAMTNLGNGWYSMTYTGTNPIDPIFTNNKGDQTSNCAEQAATNPTLYYVANGKTSVNAINHNTNYDVDVFKDATSAGYGTTIYFKNTMNWADVYCYMYYGSGDNGPAWPGVKMTSLGNGWYSMTYTGTNPINPIFTNNKGDQTSNCAEQAATNSTLYYEANGKTSVNAISHNTNYDVNVFKDAVSAAYGTTVYFKNTMNWADVYCYMYYGSGDNGPTWPGTKMTDLGNGWYSMAYTGTNPIDPIFTNNKGDQTSNCAEQAATNSTLYYVANGKSSVNAISHNTNYDVDVFKDATGAGYSSTVTTTTTTTSNTPAPSSDSGGAVSSPSASTASSSTPTVTSPKTGDASSVIPGSVVAIVSLALCIVLAKKKSK